MTRTYVINSNVLSPWTVLLFSCPLSLAGSSCIRLVPSPPPFQCRLLSAGCLSLSPWLHIVCGEQDVVGPRCPVLRSQTHWPSGCLWRGLHKASGGVSYTLLLYQVKIIELTCDVSPLQERSLLDSAFSLERWQQAELWEDPCLRIGWIHGLKNLMQHHKALEFFVKSGD